MQALSSNQIEHMTETVKGNIRVAQLYQRDRRVTDGSLEHVIADVLNFLRAVRAGNFDMSAYLELDVKFSEVFERARNEARACVDSGNLYDVLEARLNEAKHDNEATQRARAWLDQMREERGQWLNRLDALKQWRDFQDIYSSLVKE